MDYTQLRDAVAGEAVAVRARQRLQPAEGAGAKVFPPTFGLDRGLKYAIEQRIIDGERIPVVLLDSVASQANRLELALLDAWEEGQIDFPVAYVDFPDEVGLADVGRITVLEAPHRIADAIFRDSLLDGTLFRLSDIGRSITEASPRDATALFVYSPTALLFGMWDSTGPKGGLGSKFQRAIVSEIVAIRAQPGVKVGSRIDPLGIERDAGEIYEAGDPDEGWTTDPDEARKDKDGSPRLFDRKGASGKPGRPSNINHGNVAPSIDEDAGGVTFSHAEQTLVLSFAALRKLRFATDLSGQPLNGGRREAETAARTAIAALGLAAAMCQHERDHDLRSRCLLVPESPLKLELIRRDGSEPEQLDLDRDSAFSLVRAASEAASEHGLRWHEGDLALTAAPKLVELVRRSREISVSEAGE